jgi:hypothetical protein
MRSTNDASAIRIGAIAAMGQEYGRLRTITERISP